MNDIFKKDKKRKQQDSSFDKNKLLKYQSDSKV